MLVRLDDRIAKKLEQEGNFDINKYFVPMLPPERFLRKAAYAS